MKLLHQDFLRIWLVIAIALVSVSVTQSASAEAPSITVTPIWHPGTQLSTIDSDSDHQTDPGDDLRYVDLEIDVTTNVQFWAMELTCTVNKAALETYTQNSDPIGTGDDIAVVTWGSVWRLANAQVQQPFNAATGAMTIAAANAASNPLGHNMVSSAFPVATIRYRVKPVAAVTASTLSCIGSFLNTDGHPVLAPVFVMPPALNIIPAYTISGNVSYQGRTTKSGIDIQCAGPQNFHSTTDASGNFVVKTRAQGTYNCFYSGNATPGHATGAPDLYLKGQTTVALNTLSYKLLPMTLPGGNVYRGILPSDSQINIDVQDVALVTANYGSPVTVGDANGDNKTDKSDLAIVSGNFDVSEVFDASHVLYGLTRGLVTSGSRIWTDRPAHGAPIQQIPGTNVDNWPALSPDGSKLIVTRRLGSDPNYRYALFVMNLDGSGAKQLTPTTGPNGNYDAFAASWSPDGSQIAFDCATFAGWYVNDAALCLIDAAGHGFRVLDPHVSIYPPAWLDNNRLVYGGNSKTSLCGSNSIFDKDLCEVFVREGSTTNFSVGASVTPDMPVISDGALFYHGLSGGVPHFFMAELNSAGNVAATLDTTPPFTSPYHVRITRGSLGYYAVRQGRRDLIFETTNFDKSHIIVPYAGGGTWPINIGSHVPDVVNNPDWDSVPESSSYIYALRNTFIWVP